MIACIVARANKMTNGDLILKGTEVKQIFDKLDNLDEEIKSLKKLLMGNGKIGIAEMARRSFEYMQCQDRSKNGLLDWTFRIIISLVLGFIAVKVGLK